MENENQAGKQEIFEIHITGDENIHQAGIDLEVKTIKIDLLKPDGSVLRTEHMTSIQKKFDNFEACLDWTHALSVQLVKRKTRVIREKIESPYYNHYVDDSLYMESHFVTEENKLPISRNVRKTEWLATDRTYDKNEYCDFADRYKGCDIELCLYDTFVDEDKDWFSYFK